MPVLVVLKPVYIEDLLLPVRRHQHARDIQLRGPGFGNQNTDARLKTKGVHAPNAPLPPQLKRGIGMSHLNGWFS